MLEIDSNNVKAYYRRGQSQSELGDPNAALEDFEKVRFTFIFAFIHFSKNKSTFADFQSGIILILNAFAMCR